MFFIIKEFPKASFDELDLKTRVWVVLSAAENNMGLRTLLAVLGYDAEMVGPDNFDLGEVNEKDLQKIQQYVVAYKSLSQDAREEIKARYIDLGDVRITDYYLSLAWDN